MLFNNIMAKRGFFKKNILGIHTDMDACAVLISNGKLLDAVQEERFSRIKLQEGFPKKAIGYILEKNKLKPGDIDIVAYGWLSGDAGSAMIPYLIERTFEEGCDLKKIKIICERFRKEYEKDIDIRKNTLEPLLNLGFPSEKIFYIEHHLSHAWSAFATSPFSKSLIITADGRGDFKSVTACIGDYKGINMIDYLSTLDSLGHLYSQVTFFLGFKPNRHEGKITGLAAYGNPELAKPLMERLVCWKNDNIFSNVGEFYKPYDTDLSPELRNEFSKYKPEDLAAAVQSHVENLLVLWIKKQLKKVDCKNISLAGGVFANIKINQKIREIDGVENVYIQPAMNDAGTALGAAAAALFKETGQIKLGMPTVCLGPEYSEKEISLELSKFPNLVSKLIDEMPKTVSLLLQEHKVIGLFQGRMEFGPRSLGYRSIIFHTADSDAKDCLNRRFDRTEFMPFAPAIMEELANECLEGWKKNHTTAEFMTMSYSVKKEFWNDNPAVTHVDGTTRPQIVVRKHSPLFHLILDQYYKDTGMKAIINTSFNRHEEPIVCTPSDAFCLLERGVVDVLAIGNFLVTNKE